MTISEYKTMLASYQGEVRTPADFEGFWRQRLDRITVSVSTEPVLFFNPSAIYETMTVSYAGGEAKARIIRPAREGKHPLVLMFHDLNRGIRGWHHMTRFIALGYGMIALDAEPCAVDWTLSPEGVGFTQRYLDALVLAGCARALPYVDPERIVTWGEGFGGGLAIATAAMLPETVKCIALNPMPADIRSVCRSADTKILSQLDYVDAASFAPLVKGSALLGICLMNEIAKPEGQYAIFNRLTCRKAAKLYPKYSHERVNFFENEILKFLHD